MRNLKYGSRGNDVITLEKFLKEKGYYVIIDRPGRGHYGPNLKAAVLAYQLNEHKYEDGKFGPSCRGSMKTADVCKYQEVKLDRQTTLIRMHKDHTKAKALNPKLKTIKQMFNDRKKYDKHLKVVVNGTLFDTRTGIDLAALRVDGEDVGIGYYGNDGLKITRDGQVSIGQKEAFDHEFMGFSPAVRLKGKINKVFKDLSRNFLKYRNPRTLIQITDDYINVFIIRGRSLWRGWKGANFDDAVKYCEIMADYDECDDADSGLYDGGYSTGAYTWKGRVFGWISRKVANGVGFSIEDI